MAEKEEGAIGLNGSLNATKTEVETNDMMIERMACDAFPFTAICPLFPYIRVVYYCERFNKVQQSGALMFMTQVE